MISVEKKIKIYLDKTLITNDDGEYKNSKQKYFLPLAKEKIGYSFLYKFGNISKYKFQKKLEK